MTDDNNMREGSPAPLPLPVGNSPDGASGTSHPATGNPEFSAMLERMKADPRAVVEMGQSMLAALKFYANADNYPTSVGFEEMWDAVSVDNGARARAVLEEAERLIPTAFTSQPAVPGQQADAKRTDAPASEDSTCARCGEPFGTGLLWRCDQNPAYCTRCCNALGIHL